MAELTLFRLAKDNMKRRVFRTLAVVVIVGLATGTLFTATMLLRGVETGIRHGANSLGADMIVVPYGSQLDAQAIISGESQGMLMGGLTTTTFLSLDVVSEIRGIEGVKTATPQLYLSTWEEGACCRMADVQIIGFEPETDFVVKTLIENKLKWPMSPDELILGNNISTSLEDFERVSPWPVYGYNFSVVGRLRKTGTGLDWAVFIPFEGITLMIKEAPKYALPEAAERLKSIKLGSASAILVRIDTLKATPQEMKMRIKMVHPDLVVVSTAEMVTNLSRQLFSTLQGVLVFGVMVWVMSILIVGAIFSMIINERKREIGLLRAIGARAVSIFKLIMYEAVILTGFGGLMGVVFGAGVVYLFHFMVKSSLRMPYVWPSVLEITALTVLCVAAGIISGIVGTLSPAVMSSRMEPLRAIRLGE